MAEMSIFSRKLAVIIAAMAFGIAIGLAAPQIAEANDVGKHAVNITQYQHGKIGCWQGQYDEGDTAIVECVPNGGWMPERLVAVTASGEEIPLEHSLAGNGRTYVDLYGFTMPAEPVTIEATFVPATRHTISVTVSGPGEIFMYPEHDAYVGQGVWLNCLVKNPDMTTLWEVASPDGLVLKDGKQSLFDGGSDDGYKYFVMPDSDVSIHATVEAKGIVDGLYFFSSMPGRVIMVVFAIVVAAIIILVVLGKRRKLQ